MKTAGIILAIVIALALQTTIARFVVTGTIAVDLVIVGHRDGASLLERLHHTWSSADEHAFAGSDQRCRRHRRRHHRPGCFDAVARQLRLDVRQRQERVVGDEHDRVAACLQFADGFRRTGDRGVGQPDHAVEVEDPVQGVRACHASIDRCPDSPPSRASDTHTTTSHWSPLRPTT